MRVIPDMLWFTARDKPHQLPPEGLFPGRVRASANDVNTVIKEMYQKFYRTPRISRQNVWNWAVKRIVELDYDSAAFLTVLLFADRWLSQREDNDYALVYRREELRRLYERRGGNPLLFEHFAAMEGHPSNFPTVPPPQLGTVAFTKNDFEKDERRRDEARAWLIRRDAEEAEREKNAQAKHERLKEEARKAEAKRRQGLLTKNQERLAQQRAAEREAEQRALEEKRRKEQAALLRAEQRKQKHVEHQQASSEASGVSDAALRAILAEQEALERAAAAEGQGSSAWHASTAAPSPEEQARMRAEAEAAEQEVQAGRNEWIAKAAQAREAKQARKGKGKGKAPAPAPAPRPRPQLPTPPRVDWEHEVEVALRNVDLNNQPRRP